VRLEKQDVPGFGDLPVLVLSERNLRILLAKLEREDSARTIVIGDPRTGEGTLAVQSEANDAHYSHPSRQGAGPGYMHPADVARAFVTALGVQL
jgi:hypothetical protein